MTDTNTVIKPNYKQTKLGWIPEEWEVKTLDEIGVFSKGKGIAKNEITPNGKPCIRYAEIYTKYNFYTTELDSHISEEASLSSKKITYGDLLFAGSGETLEDIGKCVAYLGESEAYAGGDIVILSPNSVYSQYLGFFLNHPIARRQTHKLGQGHSVVHIYSSGLKKLKVLLPPHPEQQKIATILSTWDRALAKQQQLIAAKQQFKKGLMQLLLTGKIRFAGFEGEWRMQEIGDFGKVVSGLTYKPENVTENGVLVLRSSNIQNGKLEFYDNVYVNNNEFNPVEKDDILICVRNGSKNLIGKNTLITKDIAGVAFGAFMSVFRSKRNGYLKHLFETDLYRKEIHKNLGATINSINSGNLKRFKFLFPQDDTEQQKIASVLTAADKEIELLQKQLTNLQAQKRGLMQGLLKGETRVKLKEEGVPIKKQKT